MRAYLVEWMRSPLWRLLVIFVGITATAFLAMWSEDHFGELGQFLAYFVGIGATTLAVNRLRSRSGN